jgi:drug/metabolite transporter (DMT)-like permease
MLALAGMVLISFNFITVKYALRGARGGFNPETLTVVWMGSATFYAFVWAMGRGQLRQVTRTGHALPWLLALGAANAGCQLTMWQGLQRLDPSFAAFLNRFAPMMAILMGAVLLHERIRPLEWLAIGILIGGGAMSTLTPGTVVNRAEWVGIVFSLIAAFLLAAQWPLAKHSGHSVSAAIMNLYRVSVGLVIVVFWGFATHSLDFSHTRLDQWIVTFVGAFLGPFLSYVFTFHSYRYWDMSRSAVVWTLEPLVVLPLAWLVFGNTLGGWKLFGGFITLAGGLWLALLHRQAAEEPVDVIMESRFDEGDDV